MQQSFEEKVAEARANVPAISPVEANERRIAHPDIVFIDPREAESIEATTGRIPGALSLPIDRIASGNGDEFPPELASRSRPIITACQGGPLGAVAALALKRRGYGNVAFIEGGTQGWLDAGLPTTR